MQLDWERDRLLILIAVTAMLLILTGVTSPEIAGRM